MTRSLRARLVIGLLALTMGGLLAGGTGIYKALEHFLDARLDQQLADTVTPVRKELSRGQYFPVRPTTGQFVIPSRTFGELVEPDGTSVRYSDPDQPVPRLPDPATAVAPPRWSTVGSAIATSTGTTGGPRYRLLTTATPSGTLFIAYPMTEVDGTLDRLLTIELVSAAGVLVLLAMLSLAAVRIGLAPLARIAETAGEIAAGDLGQRVTPAEERTEIGRLGLALNAMLARIEGAFAEKAVSEDRLRRFVADASHELRTPLTSIRGYSELFRRGAADRPEDLARAMRRIEDEAARMGVLVDDMLLLARLDEGRPLERFPVDLVAVAADAVADSVAVDDAHPVAFEHPDRLVIVGDEGRLRQVAANLLTNARQHTPAGTPVLVVVGAAGPSAVLEVSDDGPGLPPGAAEHVFERFYRADGSRSRTAVGDGAVGGSGLGLSIVAAIAAAHGGAARAGTSASGGASFVVELPLVPPAAPLRSESRLTPGDAEAPPLVP